jgi:thioredoxin reductase (NADPH)
MAGRKGRNREGALRAGLDFWHRGPQAICHSHCAARTPRIYSAPSMEKMIIVGTGCAGLTAAIYAARANLSPLVLEGHEPGGQLSTTTLVENFPGFKDGIDGPELIMNMKAQAERFGARFQYATVTDFAPENGRVRVKLDDSWVETRTLVIASGASARYLGLENEKKLVGHGLTSCATCDGAFYRGVPVCVVGGGDSAAEEATFLTRFASKVYLIHRRDALRASKIMAERALNHPKIEPVWNTVVTQYLTDDAGEMRAVKLRNVKSDETRELDVKCVFVAIGHTPNTAAFKGKLDMDAEGYLLQKNGTHTNVPGVFAAGDVADRTYRQAVTAAGQGCAAALDAERYLASMGGE